MTDMISVEDLVLVYGDGTRAVDGISFKVEENGFFGFLGPNGAGKSTTIKVLTTLLRKTSGRVHLAGLDVEKDAAGIRKLIGVQSQETVVDHDLTGRENLMLQGHLQQMGGTELKQRVEELVKLVDLTDAADKRALNYSGGMKKRLDLASALVHRPRVLFLDEPTTGLDPQSRSAVWKYLDQLNKEGITIFLTTQYMEEADKLCSDLSIIDHGKIVAGGTPTELKGQVGTDTITLSLEGSEQGDGGSARAKELLTKVRGVSEVLDSDGGLTVYAKNAGFIVADIVRSFDENAIKMKSISMSSPSLDDVFLHHTGHRIRPEEASPRQTMRRMGFAARRPARQ
ncbi:MAG: ATP-binding cassette domain-containing protein [Thaumarchaeota archaeon]|nr:ATP-binding cassette domain-containing protein [Nitrososphaerota archaeon]